jgi:hypothetical protein
MAEIEAALNEYILSWINGSMSGMRRLKNILHKTGG